MPPTRPVFTFPPLSPSNFLFVRSADSEDLLQVLLDDRRLLLTRHHELETVEVCEGRTLRLGLQLLAPGGLLPSSHNLIRGPGLLQSLGTRITGDLHLQVRKVDTLQRNDLPGHVRVGAFHKDLRGREGEEGEEMEVGGVICHISGLLRGQNMHHHVRA